MWVHYMARSALVTTIDLMAAERSPSAAIELLHHGFGERSDNLGDNVSVMNSSGAAS